MCWESECVEIVRVLIDDMDTVQTYTDNRIERALLVAAMQVTREVGLTTTYDVNILEATITPDPTDPKDQSFINLICLKCAYLIVHGEAKRYGSSSMVVSDGPSSVSFGAAYKALKEIAENLKNDYEREKNKYQMGVSGGVVTTPTTYTGYYGEVL